MEIKDQISNKEKIVWEGTKDKKVSFFEAIFNPMAPFALVWFLIDSFMFGTFYTQFFNAKNGGFSMSLDTTPKEAKTTALMFVLFFVFHMMPVWIYLGGICFSMLGAKHTHYAVTEKGVYVQKGIFSTTCTMKPWQEISNISLRQTFVDKLFDTGDVIMTYGAKTIYSDGDAQDKILTIDIDNIKEYQKVFKLVKEYQEAIFTDTMYPNDLRPKENHGYNTIYIGGDNNVGEKR